MNDNIPHKQEVGWGGWGWLGLSGFTENETVSLSCLREDAFPLDISLESNGAKKKGVIQMRVGAGKKKERQTDRMRGGGKNAAAHPPPVKPPR